MRILIIEDDAPLAYGLSFHLRHAGFEVDTYGDGLSGLDAASQGKYELILLDRMLPELDGVQVLRRLRERHITTPVLIITAMTGIDDRVEGLDAGADDYLVKPFATEELLARVRALGRRTPQLSEPDRLQYGNITLNEDRGFLQSEGGASCSISKREASLLAQLMRNPNQTLPRDLLLSRVWGDAPVEGGNLDNYIYFLRKRLKVVEADSKIVTVHGLGFQLEHI
ncbi:MAG: response regulator transcription factor [Clostridia bacterium]